MDVMPVLRTASLYTSLFLHVPTKIYNQKGEEKICSSSPFGGQAEDQIWQQLMADVTDDSIYYVEGDFSIWCCGIFVDDYLLLIGPYRTKALRKSELFAYRHMDNDEASRFLKFHETIPSISNGDIQAMAHVPFMVLFNSTDIMEYTIHMRQVEKGTQIPLELKPNHGAQDLATQRTAFNFALLSALCAGDYSAAINTYDSILLTKQKNFSIINAIEGLTSLRLLTSMALSTVAVPASTSYHLLREFKLKARTINSRENARKVAVKLISESCQLVRDQIGSKYSQVVREAIDFIHRNLTTHVTIADISDAIHMTPNALTRRFRQEVGCAPTVYINRERMKLGSELLLYTNMSVAQICTQIGMLDANYFSRCFKQEYGQSPTEYRRHRQGI